MDIADLIVELVSVVTNAAVLPFLGFSVVVGASAYIFRKIAASAK